MKKFLNSNIARYLILGVLAAIIGMSVFSLNANRLAGNQVPMPFGIGASVVLSGSMEPTLSVGDLLIVKEQPGYEVGDIVVYQSGSMPVVHRIVDVAEDTVTTRGDANNVDDAAFPAHAAVHRRGGSPQYPRGAAPRRFLAGGADGDLSPPPGRRVRIPF